MAKAKCRICGTQLDTKTAHLVTTYDKNGKEKKAFFCSKEEYEKDLAKKEKAAADKDKAYRLICEIIGRKEIINSVLWKEWTIWNKVVPNEVIGQYLEENKSYLIGIVSRLDNVEFNRIRYLSAILKNKLGDFKPKAKEKEKPKVQVDETFYMPMATRNNKRRSLADLEDEF